MNDQLPEKDDGLRKLLTWVFIALVATLVLSYFAVGLVIHYFQ